eukprot:314615_1
MMDPSAYSLVICRDRRMCCDRITAYINLDTKNEMKVRYKIVNHLEEKYELQIGNKERDMAELVAWYTDCKRCTKKEEAQEDKNHETKVEGNHAREQEPQSCKGYHM